MKKFIFLVLSILLVFLVNMNVFSENTGVMDTPPKWYTNKDRLETEKQAKAKDKKIFEVIKNEIGTLGYDDGEYYSIPVTYNAQETTYWCGPASIRQSLSFHKDKSGSSTPLPSQSILAQKAGTTTDGSWTEGLRNAINSYTDIYNFEPYVAADINDQSNPLYVFESRIKYSLKYQESAPVLLIERSKLPRYNGKTGRHYITVSAYSYDYATGEKRIRNVDPDWRAKYGGYHWDPIGSETENGLFRAVSQADRDTSNKVMLY